MFIRGIWILLLWRLLSVSAPGPIRLKRSAKHCLVARSPTFGDWTKFGLDLALQLGNLQPLFSSQAIFSLKFLKSSRRFLSILLLPG